MVFLKLSGRCGNQLFRYAFARKIQEGTKDTLCIDYSYIEETKDEKNYWMDCLQYFNVVEHKKIYPKRNFILEYGNIIQKIVFLIWMSCSKLLGHNTEKYFKFQIRFQPVINYFGIYFIPRGYVKVKKSIFRNKFIMGNYEDERYFNDIKKLLIKEISPKKSLIKNSIYLNKIKNSEAVCFSIRRGDFLNKDNISLRNVCTPKYYDQAIMEIKNRVENPMFFVFSDDIEWAKKEFGNRSNFFFESGNDTIYQKLEMMASCKHFIMSNSTFCWWAQFLCVYENKKIISPSNWFNSKIKHPLISKEWILVDYE